MNLRKPLLIATLTAAVALGTVSQKAEAADPFLGALIGGGIGAAIGHDINHHGGGAVGGLVGAVIGSSIAAQSNGYYGDPYYGPDPSYAPSYSYAPAYGYAPPVYGRVVYRAPVRYYNYHRDWRDNGHRHW